MVPVLAQKRSRDEKYKNWYLVPYLSKRFEYFKTVKMETGNREPGSSSLFLINFFVPCLY